MKGMSKLMEESQRISEDKDEKRKKKKQQENPVQLTGLGHELMLLLNATVWKRDPLTSHKILAETLSHYVRHTSSSSLREAQSLQGTRNPGKQGLCCAVLSHSVVSDSAIPWTADC